MRGLREDWKTQCGEQKQPNIDSECKRQAEYGLPKDPEKSRMSKNLLYWWPKIML